jgi:multiple sugar transport system substrate-binding protein
MKKQYLYVLLIGALLLSACGSKAPAAGVTEITVMQWGSPEELTVWQQITEDFQKANPDIKVNVEVSDWDTYWTKVDTLFAAQTPPDIFAIDAPFYYDWQTRGALLNLQPYIDQTPGFLDGFYPKSLEVYKLDDGYYGLPRDFQTIVLFYNKDMFDAAGLEYPNETWTYDDLRTAAKALTLDKDGDGKTDQYGFNFDTWDLEPGWGEVIWSYGGEIVSADHTQTLLGEPKAMAGWQLLYDMMMVDKSNPDPITAGEFGSDPFLAGIAAMTPMGHWAVPEYSTGGFNMDVALLPVGPDGERFTSVNSAGFVIAKDSKAPDAAWKFIQYALSEDAQKKLTELGFAIPVYKSVAESDVFLKQAAPINHQVFLDAIAYAKVKPSFKGYTEWSDIVGNALALIWNGEISLEDGIAALVAEADAVLTK